MFSLQSFAQGADTIGLRGETVGERGDVDMHGTRTAQEGDYFQ